MANVRLLLRAVDDLEEAVAWYTARSRRAAARFQREVAAAITHIGATPELYAQSDDRHRLCPIRKSPYVLIYRFEQAADEVVVVAAPHTKQDPSKWLPGS